MGMARLLEESKMRFDGEDICMIQRKQVRKMILNS